MGAPACAPPASFFCSRAAQPAPIPILSILPLATTHMVAPFHQVGAQVGADKAGAASDEDAVGLDAGLGFNDGRFLCVMRERGREDGFSMREDVDKPVRRPCEG